MSIVKAPVLNRILQGRSAATFWRAVSLQSYPISRIPIPTEMKVELTEVEDQICVLFEDCTDYLRKEKGITTTCRIAGGWVRDKVNRWSRRLHFYGPPISVSSSYSYSVWKAMTLTSHSAI